MLNRMIAVSQDLSTSICARNDARLNPLAEAQALISRAAALHPNLYPFPSHRIPLHEPTRVRRLLGLRIDAGGPERHEDAVGLDKAFRSVDAVSDSVL